MLKVCEFSLRENLKSSDGSVISSEELGNYIAIFDNEVVSEDEVKSLEIKELFKRKDVLIVYEEEYELLAGMIKKYFQPNEKQKGE